MLLRERVFGQASIKRIFNFRKKFQVRRYSDLGGYFVRRSKGESQSHHFGRFQGKPKHKRSFWCHHILIYVDEMRPGSGSKTNYFVIQKLIIAQLQLET